VIKSEAVSGVRVQIYQVTPKDYFAFHAFESKERPTPPGKQVLDKTYAVGPRNGADLSVDLRPMLDKSGLGHLIAVVTNIPVPGRAQELQREIAWVQVTKLGVSARVDGEHMNAWVQDITPQSRFLAPIAGADATMWIEGVGGDAKSGADGHVAFDLVAPLPRKPKQPSALLQIQSGADSAFSVLNRYEKTLRVANAMWYVTDDRFTYKPGETVYLKGWVRWTHNGVNPSVELPKPGETVAWTLSDSRGAKIANGTMPLSDQGGFHLETPLPSNANLGNANFTFTTRGHATRHPISVQEFRTPAYSVTLNDDVSHSGATPVILGESIGCSRPRATTRAVVRRRGDRLGSDADSTSFAPPGWPRHSSSRAQLEPAPWRTAHRG
jgi:uncharacterized protein YfaS (alpha-2-macroglobulin family)